MLNTVATQAARNSLGNMKQKLEKEDASNPTDSIVIVNDDETLVESLEQQEEDFLQVHNQNDNDLDMFFRSDILGTRTHAKEDELSMIM